MDGVLFFGSSLVAQGSLPAATLAFEYNPTTDANLPGIAGADNSAVTAATDMTGNGRTGTQTGVLGPERKLAAVNGVNTFNFIVASTDQLLVGSGTTFSSSVYAIGMDGVFQFPSFAAIGSILTIYTPTVTANRFRVRVTTGGKLSVISRRLYADANNTVTSTIGLTAGVASFVSVQVDYAAATVRFVIDDATETLSVTTSSVPGWTGGTGATDAGTSVLAPNVGRVGASSEGMNAYVGSIRCWTGSMPVSAVQTQRLAMQAIFATPLQTVAVNAPAASVGINRVYRAVAGVAAVPVSGTVTVGGDADIEMRLINAATLVASGGWSTIATSSSLAWSATPSISAGSWFLQFRKVGERDVDAVTDTANRIGVSYVILLIGLSNINKYWSYENRFAPYPITTPVASTSTLLGSRRWSGFGWFSPDQVMRTANNTGPGTNEPYVGPIVSGCGGNGLTEACIQFQTAESLPLATLAYATGGATSEWVVGGGGWSNLLETITVSGGPGWAIDGTVLVSGEADARDGTTYADYYATLQTIYAQLQSATGDANTKLWIAGPAASATSTTTDARMNAILDATLQFISDTANVYFMYSQRDLPLSADNLHPEEDAYQDYCAPRFVQTLRCDLGLTAASGIGPEISGGTAAIGANSANVTVTQHGGTTLVDGSGSASGTGLTGLNVEVDGTARTILTAALNAGSIDLTWSGAATVAYVDIGHARGMEPDVTNPIRDNQTIAGSTVGAPLQPTNGLFRITAA